MDGVSVCMMPGDVLAAVVLYHPPDTFLANLKALLANGVEVLLVDNTPGDYPLRSQLLDLRGPGLNYVGFGENLGIGTALNEAGRAAQRGGYAWLLTLDQDSLVANNYIQLMADVLSTIPEPDTVGILAPSLSHARLGGKPWKPVTLAITSGSLVRVGLFEQVGWFDESLFIDYVDFDYCARLRKANFRVIIASFVRLQHQIGTPSKVDLPLLAIRTLNHAPIRRYYKFRNRIAMFRRYALRFPGWISRDLLSALLEPVKILVLEEDSIEKLRMIVWGTWDGLCGRHGPAPGRRLKRD